MKPIKTIATCTIGLTFFSTNLLAQGGCCGEIPPATEGGCCGDKTAPTSKSSPTKAITSGTTVSHSNSMLEGYNAVATALYKDDLASAKKSASGLSKHDKTASMATFAKKLSQAKTIKEARTIFNDLSAAAIKMAKTKKGWKVAHCPMANGNKGGDWLQKASDKRVNNPYFGATMPHCGSFKK
ncbi:MAG: DUF3347 domain-containing protein [Verrucomicrobiae bacterium]|nr:DUF3347 domain-containing protein [Verrucomicrobiae bacterium]NNJ42665.1 DUF3347 domain-containing protein [Akkermansiaceae bacterium]